MLGRSSKYVLEGDVLDWNGGCGYALTAWKHIVRVNRKKKKRVKSVLKAKRVLVVKGSGI